jgi:hypothetical protein
MAAPTNDLLGFLVGDGHLELVLELHDELDGIEGVGAEVVDEGCLARDLVGRHAHLITDDLLDSLFDGEVGHCSGLRGFGNGWDPGQAQGCDRLLRG